MRRVWRFLLLLTGLSGLAMCQSVLTCSFNGGAFTSSGCYTLRSFTATESLDWSNAYGSADTATNPNTIYNTSHGPWNAITGNGSRSELLSVPAIQVLRRRSHDTTTSRW
jgi:hypothetical protein